MADIPEFRMDVIFDLLYDQVVILDPQLKIHKANEAYASTFGVPFSQVLGKYCYDISTEDAKPCITKGKSCPVLQAFENDTMVTLEHTYHDRKGKPVHVELKAIPINHENGAPRFVAVILRNITQWKHTEDKLVDSFMQFSQIAEMGADAILVLNHSGEIEFANSKALRLTGYTRKEMMHMDFYHLLNDEGKAIFQELKKREWVSPESQVRKELQIAATGSKFVECEVYFGVSERKSGDLKYYVYVRDLSEQRKMDIKLRRANEFLSNIIESSVDGIIAADMKGKVIIHNKGAENLLGYTGDEVIGKFNVMNFYPPGVAQDIIRKLRSDDFGGKGKLLPTRITGVHKNGENIPTTLSGALIYQDGKEVASVGIFYDLREVLKVQEELLESENNFRNLFERVRHGIYFSTREGRFLDGNQAMLEMLGYENKDDFLKMELARDLYFDPADRAKFQEMIEPLGFVKEYEVKFKKATGEPVSVLLTAHVRRDKQGKIIGYQGIVVDVTGRKKLEQQLFQSEKLAAMGRLNAQIAHELNNPIYGVMNCLDLIRSEVPEGNKKRKFLDMAYSETQRISQLLRSMLNFFRPAEDIKSMVDVNQVIEEVLMFVGKQLQGFKIKVNTELNKDIPNILASGNQLKQVLLNMAINAKNAMPDGGELTLSTSHENDNVVIKIADTGTGIPPENRDRIFEAFFTTKSDVKGVGLGLSVCFGIIREHKGRIDVESQVGQGTTFIVSLPIE